MASNYNLKNKQTVNLGSLPVTHILHTLTSTDPEVLSVYKV